MWSWIKRSFLRWLIGTAGLASCFTGIIFTYKSHYEHPQYRYLPADQEWRDHLREVVELSRREVAASSPAELVVDVSGAVEKPGVYKIFSGGRVQEAILAAGGFATNADKQYIHQELNLANTLRDKDKIYIPFVNEYQRSSAVVDGGTGLRVDLNSASQEDLDGLVGIGESRAEAIIAGRPYANLEELVAKTGISKSVFEKIEQEGYEMIY